jgi:hypothetical protein
MAAPWIPFFTIVGGMLALRYVVAPRWQKHRRRTGDGSGDDGGSIDGGGFGFVHWFGGHDSSDGSGHSADSSASDGGGGDGGGGDGGGGD